jgi:multiple sugar transport system ATP-binding protein
MNIRLKNIKKEFKTFTKRVTILKNIDLEIKSGEFFVILGPSGCGKSTLLNIIAGLEKPTKGEIYFNDKLVASAERKIFLSPRERNVAMVFQNYALYPHLTVYENIAFPLRISKMPEKEIDKKVKEVAEMLHIIKHLNSKPSNLSGGEKQRVAIARAIVRKPSVLLFDEPLSNLDPDLRTKTRIEIKRLQKNLGITTIYVTHDQIEAMTLGDRIAVINNGYIQQVDTPENLYERPANVFVAQFIGYPLMNIFDAEVFKRENDTFMKFGDVIIKVDFNLSEGKYKVGIRPSDIEIVDDDSNYINGVIDAFEFLGKDILLYVSYGNMEFRILTSARNFKIGDRIKFKFVLQKLYFFKTNR